MDKREILGHTRQFLDSPAFVYVFQKGFRPIIQLWAHRLLTDETLPDDERRGIVIAMREFYGGFVKSFAESDLDPPEWLEKEFFRALISE